MLFEYVEELIAGSGKRNVRTGGTGPAVRMAFL
jgi:hypothetical protein